jgi:type I restriction enzyme S subunit
VIASPPLALRDVAEIIMGQSPAGEDCNREGLGLPLLNGPTEFGPTHPEPAQYTTDPKKRALPGDLLFCVRGSTTGRMNWADQEYAIGRGIAALRHKLIPKLQPLVRAVIEQHLPVLLQAATGSTFPNVSGQQLAAIPFPNVAPTDALAIASVLGALDDKIELNRRMNETLEAMARAIFKDWFVDFGPTRAKMEGRAPYLAPDIWSLFPDRLDDEGKPEGWKREPLGTHMSNFDSKRVPVSGGERAKRQGPFPYHGATGVMDHVDAYLFDGIYLLVGEDGSVVKDNGLAFTQYVWGKIWVNNHAHVLQGRDSVSTEHLLLYFQHEVVIPYITGAVQLKLSQGRMNAMPFIYAGASVCEAFTALIAPFFAKYRANADESKMLAATRDLLLPKLMSGEVRVKDAEKLVGEAS